MGDVFFTDWEGPWVLTDFAYECAIAFFNSHEFFERLSQYDDYLILVEKKEGYEAGDTLKLLAVFLSAEEISSEDLRDLAEKVLKFTPDAEESMNRIKRSKVPIVISTTYEQFLEFSTRLLGIEHAYGTRFEPERYRLSVDEREEIKNAVEIIANLPEITIPVDERAKRSIEWLNDFFWNRLQRTKAKAILDDVKAIGGTRKLDVVKRFDVQNPIVIGDSISDKDMLLYARTRGIAISFNGNEFALKNSNVAIVSESSLSEAEVVERCFEEGIDWIGEHENVTGGRVYRLELVNFDDILRESKRMRAKLRGLAGYLS
jgi:predicted HAD superfamily phosphohydrolase